jgi:hypothetical protein
LLLICAAKLQCHIGNFLKLLLAQLCTAGWNKPDPDITLAQHHEQTHAQLWQVLGGGSLQPSVHGRSPVRLKRYAQISLMQASVTGKFVIYAA